MKLYRPINLSRVNTYSLKDRSSKLYKGDFATPHQRGGSLEGFLDSLPNVLAVKDFNEVVGAIIEAREKEKPVIWAMGAHPIKCGLNPVIIDLMRRGVITALALNGAGIVHDYELALVGRTSEDVDREIRSGAFGMAKETAEGLNGAIKTYGDYGIGTAVGKMLNKQNPPCMSQSIMATAAELNILVTVHVAIGTDIIHMHPSMDGASVGKASHIDFRLLTSVVTDLRDGGVFLNVGSAVILPEVFLKALNLARNLSLKTIEDFTTVNMDFIQHYRPQTNVLKRPTAGHGKGYSLTGHHEIMIPLLAAALIEKLS